MEKQAGDRRGQGERPSRPPLGQRSRPIPGAHPRPSPAWLRAGIEAFCKDLKLDPSDRKVLLLAWRFGAKRMGFFSREEFKSGGWRCAAWHSMGWELREEQGAEAGVVCLAPWWQSEKSRLRLSGEA